MDTGNWINLGIFALTALGVLAAWHQARVAKSAAKDAREHEKAALAAAQDTAAANERTAHALEEANAIAERATEKPRWRVVPSPAGLYRVENRGPGKAFDVRLEIPDYPAGLVRFDKDAPFDLDEGLATSFTIKRAWGTPRDAILAVSWSASDGGPTVTDRCSLTVI